MTNAFKYTGYRLYHIVRSGPFSDDKDLSREYDGRTNDGLATTARLHAVTAQADRVRRVAISVITGKSTDDVHADENHD